MSSIASLGGALGSSDYFTSKINDLFSKTDTSGDGQISFDEFSAIGQNLPAASGTAGKNDPAALFKQIDSDGNGSLSKAELTDYVKQQITQAQSALLNIQELFGGDGRKAHGHHGHHHQGGAQPADAAGQAEGQSNPLDALFQAIDSNSDGSVSSNELSGFLAQYQKAQNTGGGSAASG